MSTIKLELEVDDCMRLVRIKADMPGAVFKSLGVYDHGQTAQVIAQVLADHVRGALLASPRRFIIEADRVSFVVPVQATGTDTAARIEAP